MAMMLLLFFVFSIEVYIWGLMLRRAHKDFHYLIRQPNLVVSYAA